MAGDLQKYLIQDLELLHDDRDSADLEFVAGGGRGKPERIRAHRLIVLCRCRRYRNKKQQWLAANSPLVTVKLERTEPETARRVVRYLYTGQVSCVVHTRETATLLFTCTCMGACSSSVARQLALLHCKVSGYW